MHTTETERTVGSPFETRFANGSREPAKGVGSAGWVTTGLRSALDAQPERP